MKYNVKESDDEWSINANDDKKELTNCISSNEENAVSILQLLSKCNLTVNFSNLYLDYNTLYTTTIPVTSAAVKRSVFKS